MKVFLASPDALEVIVVPYSLTYWTLGLTWLMWPWWVMIPIGNLTEINLAIEDTDEVMKMMKMMQMMKKTWLMWPWWVMIPIDDLTDVTLAI